METSENTATPSPTPAATARRSGRERRAPEKFQPEANIAPKRKRDDADPDADGDDDENQDPAANAANAADDNNHDEPMTDDADEDEDSPDEEEKRAARRQQKKKSSAVRARKPPAAKKPKINGSAPSRSVSIPSRPKAAKKSVRVITGDRRDGDGVYGEHE